MPQDANVKEQGLITLRKVTHEKEKHLQNDLNVFDRARARSKVSQLRYGTAGLDLARSQRQWSKGRKQRLKKIRHETKL